MTEDEPQNIYDDPAFLEGYSRLARFNAPFGSAMEHGPFLEMLGDVSGLEVLDLGCGAGQLAYHLAQDGAARVIATDVSERMLDVARNEWAHERVTYQSAAMEDADFPAEAFDLVVSSLAFHYVKDFALLVQRLATWLRPGGLLVFSTEHPIYAARATDEGWLEDDGVQRGWVIDDYAVEGPRERTWFVGGVRRYHRTMATILNTLIEAGFKIDRVWESHPSPEWLQRHPDHAEELRRPMFLLVRARKT